MYEVLQRAIDYVRSSGDKICDVFYIDRNINNLIFCKSKGTASSSHNEDYYEYLQFVDLASFKTIENTRTYLPLDQVGEGKKYSSIPRTGTTKYGKLVVNEHRRNDSSGNSSSGFSRGSTFTAGFLRRSLRRTPTTAQSSFRTSARSSCTAATIT